MLKRNQYNNFYNLLPHNTLAEEIILGHCISKIDYSSNITISYIDSNLFSLEKNKIVYLSYLKIYHQKSTKESKIAQLINTLWLQKILSKIGGIKQITKLIQKSTTISSFFTENTYLQYFIDILYFNYTRRLLVQYSYSILQLSYKKISTTYIYNQSKKYLQKIARVIKIQENSQCNNLVKQFLFNFHIQNISLKTKHILSGFKELDSLTQGFQSGDLIIIAGRPSMGKTSLAINIAHYILFQLQLSIHIFSLEMSKQEILDKIIAIESRIKYTNIKNKVIKTYEWNNLQRTCKLLLNSDLMIDDNSNACIEYIKYQKKQQKNKKKILLS